MERNGERVELVINQNGMFDTAANAGNPNLTRIELGTIWNEWQDNWVGRAVEGERRNIGGVIREQQFRNGAQEDYYKDKKLQPFNK